MRSLGFTRTRLKEKAPMSRGMHMPALSLSYTLLDFRLRWK